VTSPTMFLTDITTATPASRDRYADFLRVASIGVVVIAHWLLVLVVLDGTDALGASRIAQLVTWAVMVMPVFFAVGGFSHAKTLTSARRRAYREFVGAEAARLLGPVLVLLLVWVAAAVVLETAGAGGRPIELALDRVPTPLWFIAVYLVVVAAAPAMHAVHRRLGLWALLSLVAVVAVLDALRYLADVAWAGPLNIIVVWLTIHQLGFGWADGSLTRRARPAVLALAGFGGAVLLTLVMGWYPVDMQGLPGSSAANFAPPNLALLAHGFGLIGAALLVRAPVTRWLQRPKPWAAVVVGNSVIMTLFCWHLTAAFAVQGLLLLSGVSLPPALTTAWWALVPVWLVACAVPMVILVVAFRPSPFVDKSTPGGSATPTFVDKRRVGEVVAVTAVALTAGGLFVVSQVGLDGLLSGRPDRVFGIALPAWTGLVTFVIGSVLFRRRPADSPA